MKNVNCKEQGNVIETQYFGDLELCKQECLKLPFCQGFALHVAGNCTFLRNILLQRCTIDQALSLYIPDGGIISCIMYLIYSPASISSGWSPWSSWSSTCSASLTRSRSRRCLQWGCSQPCQGHHRQEKECALQQQVENPRSLTNLTLWASDSSYLAQPGLIRSLSVHTISGSGSPRSPDLLPRLDACPRQASGTPTRAQFTPGLRPGPGHPVHSGAAEDKFIFFFFTFKIKGLRAT